MRGRLVRATPPCQIDKNFAKIVVIARFAHAHRFFQRRLVQVKKGIGRDQGKGNVSSSALPCQRRHHASLQVHIQQRRIGFCLVRQRKRGIDRWDRAQDLTPEGLNDSLISQAMISSSSTTRTRRPMRTFSAWVKSQKPKV